MRQLRLIIAAALVVSPIAANADFINGSLEGQVGAGQVPAGWSINSITPDTTSATNQPFTFNVNPGDSPDGGTWVALARNTNVFESFGQTVAGLIVGTTYEISYYVTNTGCCSGGFSADAEILVDVDLTNVFTGTTRTQDGTWYQEAFNFTATAASHRFDFYLATGLNAYMGIDGISMVASDVPEPGTLALLGIGLIGVGMARRNRKV